MKFPRSNPTPKISVVMPVWNGAAHLREAVDSILGQSFGDFEFLILDDGSNDATPEILRAYEEQDERVRVLTLGHEGIVVALNRGVDEAKAEWIARMDCDDIAHPDRLKLQWEALRRHPEASLCHTQIEIFGESQFVTPAARFINSEAMIKLRLCYQCPIVHPSVVFRKQTFHDCGGYLADERHAEDFGLWGRMIAVSGVIGLAQPLLRFRVHSSSISKKAAEIQIPLSASIARRHCQEFMRLSEAEAHRAYETLRHRAGSRSLRDWLWLLIQGLPQIRPQSVELWAWAMKKSVQRFVARFRES